MNHKRGKPKSRRAGCLYCKSYKHQREKDSLGAQTVQERRQRLAEIADARAFGHEEGKTEAFEKFAEIFEESKNNLGTIASRLRALLPD